MFTKLITRTSSAASALFVDIIRGTAMVQFNNGDVYKYSNVSRRAIANLMANDNMSTGFWINQNLVDAARTKCRRPELAYQLV